MKKLALTTFILALLPALAWGASFRSERVIVEPMTATGKGQSNLTLLSMSSTTTWTAITITAGPNQTADIMRVQNSTGLAVFTIYSMGAFQLGPLAQMWDDVQMGFGNLGSGASAPDPINFNGTGIVGYGFNGGSTLEQLYGSIDMPHDWQIGTGIEVHVHGAATTANTGHVVFQVEVGIGNLQGTLMSTVSTYRMASTISGHTAWVSEYIHYTSFIDMSAYGLGTQLIFRVFRDPSDAGDTYPDDWFLFNFSFHYRKDSLGSKQEYTK